MLVDVTYEKACDIGRRVSGYDNYLKGLAYISNWLQDNCKGGYSIDGSEWDDNHISLISFDDPLDAITFQLKVLWI